MSRQSPVLRQALMESRYDYTCFNYLLLFFNKLTLSARGTTLVVRI